jgi:hypothetical protein
MNLSESHKNSRTQKTFFKGETDLHIKRRKQQQRIIRNLSFLCVF